MVGVGGRSKACDQCRRRRVKCDESRPTCRRCEKAKLQCGGYRAFAVIAYEGNKKSPKSGSHFSRLNAVPDSLMQGIVLSSEPRYDTKTAAKFDYAVNPIGFQFKPDADQLFNNYALAHLITLGEDNMSEPPGGHNELADAAWIALCAYYYGDEHNVREAVEYGLQKYARSLKDLNMALSNVTAHNSIDVIRSVMVMMLLEYLMSDDISGWVGHSVGLERLLELQGPSAFTGDFELSVLQSARPSIIFAAFSLHRPTILSRPEWKTVPWAMNPSRKTPFEYLIDIMADCPDMFDTMGQISRVDTSSASEALASELHAKTMRLSCELEDWKMAWDILEGDYYEETDISGSFVPTYSLPGGEKLPFWSKNIVYKSQIHANAMTIYQSLLLLFEWMFYTVAGGDVDDLRPTQGLQTPFDRKYSTCIDICRCLDGYVRNAHGRVGSFYIFFPIKMCWNTVAQREPALGAYLQDVLHEIQYGKRGGRWKLAGYILAINKEQSPMNGGRAIRATEVRTPVHTP